MPGRYAGGELAAGEAEVELLSSLVDKSLLQPLGDGTRLRMLETTREYGAEKLAAPGRGRRTAAAARRVLHRADARGGAQAADQRPASAWLTVLRADRDNILAALRYWYDAERHRERAEPGDLAQHRGDVLGNDTDVTGWTGEALAVPGEAVAGLRTIAEALHVVTSAMGPAAEGTAAGAAADGIGVAYPWPDRAA